MDVVQLRARVGMVFQKPNPFPKSIFENVAYGPRIHGLVQLARPSSTRSSRSSLKRAGLWDEVKDRLQESGTALSGGQQQRLCIARAIAVDPEVILMDEPCSALDPIATAKIEELIHELRGRYAIAIVTHNMQQAARVSQRTAFFHLGELVEYGKTVGDLHQPARTAHPGLYHRPLRLIGADQCSSRPADIRSRRSTRTSNGCARSSARWAASPNMRSAKPCAASSSATSRARGKVVDDDKKLDALEIETERRAVQLIALRAPMAGDLRDVVAALKISGVVERIGDYAKNIAKRVPMLESAARSSPCRCFRKWRGSRPAMVHDVLDAFVERDAEAAVRVCERDQAVDDFYDSIFRALLTHMMENPHNIGQSAHLLFVAKNLERVGDHATNIAEMVYYAATGEHMADRPRQESAS